MNDELITLTKKELQRLLSNDNSNVVIVSEPTTATLLFKSVAINSSDIRFLNEKHIASKINNVDSYAGTTFSRNQTFDYEYSFDRKKLRDNGPSSRDIHELIRKLTLAIMGENLNKNLSYEDWTEARDDYIKIKTLFLSLYRKRLDGLLGGD